MSQACPPRDDRPADLHRRLQQLEQRRTELQEELDQQQQVNRRLRENLELLARGLLGLGRWWLVVVAVFVVGLVAMVVYGLTSHTELKVRPVVSRPLRPHLLITSEPTGASARLRGRKKWELAPGKTPLLRTAPAGEIEITVEARGHKSATRTVILSESGGAHLHVKLEPLSAGYTPILPGGNVRPLRVIFPASLPGSDS